MKKTVDFKMLRNLAALLAEENKLHTDYLEILEEERSSIVGCESAGIERLSTKREMLLSRISELHTKRVELTKNVFEGEQVGLISAVSKLINSREYDVEIVSEARKVHTLARNLKKLATEVRAKTGELSQVVKFSQSLVSGMLSILWSATQSITRAYTKEGQIKESHQPVGSRVQSLLKEA